MLINKAHVKKYALEVSATQRGGKFTRVSNEFLIYIESCVKDKVQSYIQHLPSVGKTIK